MDDFNKTYNKYMKNNLPTPFWDEERKTLEYVNVKEPGKELIISNTLTEALGSIIQDYFYYPFTCKYITGKKEGKKIVSTTRVGHLHAHSFEDVVKKLYDSPESFSISENEKEYYSKQELNYLRRLQKFLLLIDMKDLKQNEKNRFKNKKYSIYQNALIYCMNDEAIKDILNKKRNYIITKWYKEYPNKEINKQRALIVDKEDNFKCLIEFTKSENRNTSEIKNINLDNLIEDKQVNLKYFNIIEIFNGKEYNKKDSKED
ncbi:MAG: hypothetical protein IJO57_04240 [Bacilli bacterium]|nr:hypothetical protein [Bacilli bacterium]